MEFANIILWGEQVGVVAWNDANRIASFEFQPDFLNKGWDVAPLIMPINNAKNRVFSFPEHRNNSTFKGLPGLLADILPDKYGNALINTWLASQGRDRSLNPIEILSFINNRGMGALEIEPAINTVTKRATKIEIESLVDIVNDILKNRQNFKTQISTNNEKKALSDILKIGTSAGGARAKAIIAYNSKTKDVRSGQVKAPEGFTYWILKFDGVSDAQFGASNGYGRVEMAYHLMAKDAGIEMTECQLFEENGRAHFMTKRFDRTDDGEKIHMQSFCAMRHFDFNIVGYYSYEQLFETMRALGLAYPEAEQLFRRMVFNVLARNCDDHTKNFAFLMDKIGKWKLSPAYDVCHAYRPESNWVNQQSLSVNGKRENISTDDFLAVARQMNIKKAKHIIDEITAAIKNWQNYAEQINVDAELRDAIQETLLA